SCISTLQRAKQCAAPLPPHGATSHRSASRNVTSTLTSEPSVLLLPLRVFPVPSTAMSDTLNLPFLKALSEAPGVPGREERVREILHREAKGLFDDITTDPMGNLIATKRSKAPGAKRVLLACHIDEIGFYVRHVDEKGFVRV